LAQCSWASSRCILQERPGSRHPSASVGISRLMPLSSEILGFGISDWNFPRCGCAGPLGQSSRKLEVAETSGSEVDCVQNARIESTTQEFKGV
jgi:hypothetical protein